MTPVVWLGQVTFLRRRSRKAWADAHREKRRCLVFRPDSKYVDWAWYADRVAYPRKAA